MTESDRKAFLLLQGKHLQLVQRTELLEEEVELVKLRQEELEKLLTVGIKV